ncbi:MAG: hypothetical protein CFE29_27175 [Bradyrhizobiaceae bacterium PARB1]|nr:MAG: hypothetical protein CFE29_27175 [Bradyrhizobiaceae bacterium PARB1]
MIGVPTVQAPSVSASLSIANATAVSQQTMKLNQGGGNARPSVIIVEMLGYGGVTRTSVARRGTDWRGEAPPEYDPSAASRSLETAKSTNSRRRC